MLTLTEEAQQLLSAYPAFEGFHDINSNEARFSPEPSIVSFAQFCEAPTLQALNDHPNILSLFVHGHFTQDEFSDELLPLLTPENIARASAHTAFLDIVFKAMDNTARDITNDAVKLALGTEEEKITAIESNKSYLVHLHNSLGGQLKMPIVALRGLITNTTAEEISRFDKQPNTTVRCSDPPQAGAASGLACKIN